MMRWARYVSFPALLAMGETIGRANFYVLRRRSEKQPEKEVKKAFEEVDVIGVKR